ncbi:uncharacterized protein [Procambarus clarkii]|uniref:uncharacterized protein isoform X3 n=1 Tax=Procambarus clarkii TaxID=6728 RepID=UPI001E67617B|nr:uncharacterized protein LOC123770657 isoform X3 [Procambarus clarkii]
MWMRPDNNHDFFFYSSKAKNDENCSFHEDNWDDFGCSGNVPEYLQTIPSVSESVPENFLDAAVDESSSTMTCLLPVSSTTTMTSLLPATSTHTMTSLLPATSTHTMTSLLPATSTHTMTSLVPTPLQEQLLANNKPWMGDGAPTLQLMPESRDVTNTSAPLHFTLVPSKSTNYQLTATGHQESVSPEELEQSPQGSEAETVGLQPHTNTAMIVTSVPVPMANLQTTHNLPENGTVMLCSLQQQQGQHTLILPQMQPSSHTTQMLDVPILSDSEGEYGFTVTVEEKERTTKSPMWLMSRITNKLYTNINKSVPFEIHLKKPINNKQFCIRAVPVFSSPQFLRTNVNRCPNHAAPTDATNHDFPYPEHVIRADHPEARYIKGTSGRLSVTVPLDTLQDGSDYTPVLLRFMCLGSCVGGINRRPIAVILTLENSLGKECGRKVIDVRVCACPTRDIRTDEQGVLNKGVKRKCSSSQERVPIVARKKPKTLDPKTEPHDDDKKTFFIPVYGEKLYNFLMDMKAVYYRSHPEYAAKYPDDDVLLRSITTSSTCAEKQKETSDCRSNIDELGTWDSEVDSPQQVTYDDPQNDSFNASRQSLPSQLQSHVAVSPTMKLMVVDAKRSGGGELFGSKSTQNSSMNVWPQISEAVVSNSQISSVPFISTLTSTSPELRRQSVGKFNMANVSKINLTKHVPVVQVSSYKAREPATRKLSSDYTIGIINQSLSLYKNSLLTQKQFHKDEASLSNVRQDSSAVQEEQLPHDSPEMLAANVLVKGFAKE